MNLLELIATGGQLGGQKAAKTNNVEPTPKANEGEFALAMGQTEDVAADLAGQPVITAQFQDTIGTDNLTPKSNQKLETVDETEVLNVDEPSVDVLRDLGKQVSGKETDAVQPPPIEAPNVATVSVADAGSELSSGAVPKPLVDARNPEEVPPSGVPQTAERMSVSSAMVTALDDQRVESKLESTQMPPGYALSFAAKEGANSTVDNEVSNRGLEHAATRRNANAETHKPVADLLTQPSSPKLVLPDGAQKGLMPEAANELAAVKRSEGQFFDRLQVADAPRGALVSQVASAAQAGAGANPANRITQGQPQQAPADTFSLNASFAEVSSAGVSREAIIVGTTASQSAGISASVTPHATAAAPVQQILAQVSIEEGKASNRVIEVRLEPEELGKVRISFTARDAGMVVSVFAERPETLDLLRRHSDALQSGLSDMDFEGADLEFSDERPTDHASEDDLSIDLDQAVVQQHMTMTASIGTPTDRLDIRL